MIIQQNIKLAKYSTFNIGGKAEFFVEVKKPDDLVKAVNFAKRNKLKISVLGGGSNILLPDEGIKGLIVRINICGIKLNGDAVYAGAGEVWDKVVGKAVSRKLGGIENLSLIPGTVGGAIYQNIGAYGAEIKDAVDYVDIFDVKSGNINKLLNKDCHFGYRTSIFQNLAGKNYIIIGVALNLSGNHIPNIKYPDLIEYFKNKLPTTQEIRKAVIKIRKSKLIYPSKKIGTAGSFFKNPIISSMQFNKILKKYPDIKGRETINGIKLFAGQLVEMAGWKGRRFGNVGVSPKHAMVLVSYRNARAKDILRLSKLIQKSVKNRFGIKLEPEVKFMV